MSFDEDAVLQHLVIVVCVVVGLFQAQEGLVVVDAVGYHDGFGLGIHLEQFTCIEDALFAVVLTLFVKHERNHGEGVGHGFEFLVQLKMCCAKEEWVERVVMDE